MSGVNAHAIISRPEALPEGRERRPATAAWQRSMQCFVDVLVALHPLLGPAAKVGVFFFRNRV
jgi:hypothetical protein